MDDPVKIGSHVALEERSGKPTNNSPQESQSTLQPLTALV